MNYYNFYNRSLQGNFKIQSGHLNCNSEKVLYLLKCKVCGQGPYVGKAEAKFRYRFNNYKSKHRVFRNGNRKIPQKFFHDHYCLNGHLRIDDEWYFTLFEQCETHKQLKKREKPLGYTGLKLFTHQVLMRKWSTYISIPDICE